MPATLQRDPAVQRLRALAVDELGWLWETLVLNASVGADHDDGEDLDPLD